jgi:zinc protease
MKHLMIGAATAVLAATALGGVVQAAETTTAVSVPPMAFTKRVLKNGVTVYALRDLKSASVTVDVYYGVGNRDDPRGRSGFAHLFEHMMFRDTRDLSADQSEGLVADAGGTRNGSTLFDYTVYTTTVPANHLERALWLEGQRMSGLVVDKAAFEAERHIVQQEMNQRIYASPYGRILMVLMPKTVYRDHPYALQIGGTMADLDAATVEDARAFHEAFYRPDNATLVVSGNFKPAELNRWLDRHLGALPRPKTPVVRDRSVAPEGAEAMQVVAYAPNVPLPAVIQAWHAPRPSDPDFAVLQVLEAVLVEGPAARLNRTLIDQKGLASRIYVRNIPAADGGVFAPTVILAAGQTVAAADAALSTEIARLRDEPIPVEELERVRNQVLADALRERETAAGRAEVFGSAWGVTGDPTAADRALATVRTVTPAELQRVARRYLAEDRRVDIHYLDETARAGGPAETVLPPRPVTGGALSQASLAPIALRPAGEREAPPAPQPVRTAPAPAVAEHVLPNGLRVVVTHSSDRPLVSMNLVVAAGSETDPNGKAGLSAMTAALAVRGTQTRSAAQIQDAMAGLGADLSARTDTDGAVVSVSAPQANIEAATKVLADITLHPSLRPAEFESQRGQDLSAVAESLSQPRAIAMKMVEPLLYGDTPYGRIATEASLKAITAEDVSAWRAAHWRPDRATLVITGGLDAASAFALAERLFGGWTAPATPAPAQAPSSLASASGRVVVIDLPKSGQTAVMVTAPGVLRTNASYAALSAGNVVLSKAISQEIRVKRGLSYGGGSLLTARRAGGHLLALSQVRNDAAPEAADLILAEIARYAAEPIPADVLRNRAALLTGSYGNETETTQGLANTLSTLVETGAPTSEAAAYPAKLLAATPGRSPGRRARHAGLGQGRRADRGRRKHLPGRPAQAASERGSAEAGGPAG